ncbi:ABC transporter ATP-binding protein [Micromonospora matsumotoense]|uniref:ABC transporter ATP-binding protein n=1 Tax=Micromonospora matsumotoense TaxID=121616 RepID=UPI00341E589E
MAGEVVSVAGLHVEYRVGHTVVPAVRGVDLHLRAGECLAVVGESGSGKTAIAKALVGLTGPGSRVRADRLVVGGEDVNGLDDRGWRRVRGARVGLVLQDALTSLDPVRPVGAEIAEAVRNHRVVARREVATRVRQLLADAQVPQPDLRARQYPHQLSGGLRQRALIAAAMAADPPVLVADEPTTALDVTVQARVLDLLAARKSAGTAVLLISHDLSVVARLADRVAVLHDGVVVETGETAELLRAPTHPYTRRLLAATPTAHLRGARLAGPRTTPVRTRSPRPTGVVAEVRAVSKLFRGPDRQPHRAVSGVSFTLSAGEILGVVGESGSGKTTLAHLLLGLLEPESGTIELFGRPWSGVPESRRRRGQVQWVQQDPLGSFDPRYRVSRLIEEAGADRARVHELLDQVGLDRALADRHPTTLSGGQRQRVAIARALAPTPQVIVCDEPVSALDVSVQAQILDLFTDIRADLGTAIVLISHDLGVVHHVADRVLVMRDGKVVESGQVTEVFARPAHPYTRELVGALPRPEDAYAGQPEGVT